MKKIIYLLVAVLSFSVFFTKVNAVTVEELTAELNTIPATQENGVYYLDMPMIETSKIKDESLCLVTLEDMRANYTRWMETDPLLTMPSDAELAEQARNDTNYCVDTLKESLLDYFFKINNLEIRSYDLQVTHIDDTHITIRKQDVFNPSTYVERDYTLRFVTNYDEKIKSSIDDVSKGIKSNYTIYGFQMINSVYHYGSVEESVYQNDLVLYRFPELKQYIEDNKEYKFIPILYGAGGTLHITGNKGFIGIMKADLLYKVVPVSFAMDHTFFVDKDATGDIFEKVVNRIKNYFNNTIEVTVDKVNAQFIENDIDLNFSVNNFLGTTRQEYTGYFTNISIGNYNNSILIVETSAENLDIAAIKSKDKNTDVTIETDSYEVSIDTIIDVNNVTNSDYVIKAENNNGIKLLNAYDINLKKKTDGTFINTISNGVEVYLPVVGYNEGDKVNIYYIKQDSSIGEKIEAVVVKENEKLYAKFTTTHFSTYAVETKKEVSNPNTGDGILNFIILGSFSIIILLGTCVYLNKKQIYKIVIEDVK